MSSGQQRLIGAGLEEEGAECWLVLRWDIVGVWHFLWLSLQGWGLFLIPQVANAQSPVCHLTSALSQHLCSELSSVSGVCLNPRCSASEGKTEEQDSAPDLPEPNPLGNMKQGCRFQPIPGGFGGSGTPGQRWTPPRSRHSGRACPPFGKPELREEGLTAASPAQTRVFSQGGDLYMPKLIVGGF